LIIYAPLKGQGPLDIVSKNNKKYSFFREKVGGEKGVCGGVWECGKPVRFSIFPYPGARGKRGGDFLFKPPLAALFGSPFPPSRPQAFPAAADFLFCFFFLLEVLI